MDDWLLRMDGTRNERTIAAAAAVEGIGYWSGRDVRVEFRPAPPRSGIVFVRGDLPGCPRIPAAIANRSESPLRTVLRCGRGGRGHGRARHGGLGGHADRQLRDPRQPGGNARLSTAPPPLRPRPARGRHRRARRRRGDRAGFAVSIRLGDERSWIEARPSPSGGTMICNTNWTTAAATPSAGNRWKSSFRRGFSTLNLAPSRTFLLEPEAAALQAQGLGLRATFGDLLVFDAAGADRQLPAISRRVRAAQNRRHGRRPRPGRLRPGRTTCRLSQRTSPQRRAGPRRCLADERGRAETRRRRMRRRQRTAMHRRKNSRSLGDEHPHCRPCLDRSSRRNRRRRRDRPVLRHRPAGAASAAARGWKTTSP